ncbi:MAG: SufS family cysteine desulfurase [bacterium]|nr:SufS family cysteine desulfurase [bacterium]
MEGARRRRRRRAPPAALHGRCAAGLAGARDRWARLLLPRALGARDGDEPARGPARAAGLDALHIRELPTTRPDAPDAARHAPPSPSAATLPSATAPSSTVPSPASVPQGAAAGPRPGLSLPGGAASGAPVPAAPGLRSSHAPWTSPPVGIEAAHLPPLFGGGSPVPAPSASGRDYYFLTASGPQSAAGTPSSPKLLTPTGRRIFDVRDVRNDFPILRERINGRPLVWLDNAATTHKPQAVLDRIAHYYTHEYSNVHRAAHTLAARSTDAYEGARTKVQRFIGAASPSEIVFVRGTTEGVNLVANGWGRRNVRAGDEIVLTTLEHHSNIVPWQFLAEAVGARIRVVPVSDRGEVLVDEYEKLLNDRTRIVAITQVSNALGTIVPVREMAQMAHRYDARVLVDGAQAVSHFPVNVQQLDADFYVFSGHKLFAPTGVGVVYGKRALLDAMPPWQGGGNMIDRVTFERSTFADPPARFEAGTATLADAVGLGAAVDYLDQLGMENVAWHERELLAHATEALRCIPGLHLVGTAPDKAGVVSFVVDDFSVEDMGRILDRDGIAVRAGHHCAQPTMDRFGLAGTVRPSLALYNTHDDVDQLERAIRRALQR